MSIEAGYMLPHPPIAIPTIGNGDEKSISKTIEGMKKVSRAIAKIKPDTIVLISAHSTLFFDYFHISPGESAKGTFEEFPDSGIEIEVKYDTQLVQEITRYASISGIAAGTMGEQNPSLDHGCLVPLWYLREAFKGSFNNTRFVRIGFSGQSFIENYRLGITIKDAAQSLGRRVVVIASGDLSHCLNNNSPYAIHPDGIKYDKSIMEAMTKAEFNKLFLISQQTCENAVECAHQGLLILAGTFDGQTVNAERYSYENSLGIGFGICAYSPKGKSINRLFLDTERKRKAELRKKRISKEDNVISLARKSLEMLIINEEKLEVPPETPPYLTDKKAGVFVSIYKDGHLRGCVGSIDPNTDNIATEIIRTSQCAGTRDTRFLPIQASELDDLTYCIDILSEPESIKSIDELDIKKYGVIVSRGFKKALMLPDLSNVHSVEEQVNLAREIAGIDPKERIKLQRFTVERHEVLD